MRERRAEKRVWAQLLTVRGCATPTLEIRVDINLGAQPSCLQGGHDRKNSPVIMSYGLPDHAATTRGCEDGNRQAPFLYRLSKALAPSCFSCCSRPGRAYTTTSVKSWSDIDPVQFSRGCVNRHLRPDLIGLPPDIRRPSSTPATIPPMPPEHSSRGRSCAPIQCSKKRTSAPPQRGISADV